MDVSSWHLLPPHIIKAVVEYVLESPDDLNMFMLDWEDEEDLFSPLLHTCRQWRAVCLPMMFAACDAVIGNEPSFGYRSFEKHPCIVSTLHTHYNQYVRSMHVQVDLQSIANGTALAKLYENGHGQLRLTSVQRLNVELGILPISGAACVANTKEFIAFMDDMLPQLYHTKLTITDRTTDKESVAAGLLSTMLHHFASKTVRFDLDIQNASKIFTIEKPIHLHNISKLACSWDNCNYQDLARTLHANTQSLEELYICFNTTLGFERLVLDEHGEYMHFPNLTKLSLDKLCRDEIPSLPPLHGAAPFPRLKNLHIPFAYPFSNDLPLRGSGRSLASLSLNLDTTALQKLNACNTFAGTHLHKLDSLALSGDASKTTDDQSEYTHIVNTTLTRIAKFSALSQTYSKQFLAHLPCFQFNNLQLLTLVHNDLSLEMVVAMLEMLPGLKRLQCAIAKLGSKLNNQDIPQMTQTLQALHNTSNSQLQVWQLQDLTNEANKIMVTSVLLLIASCPNLHTIVVPQSYSEQAESIYSKLVFTPAYATARQAIIPNVEFKLDQIKKTYYIKIKRRPFVVETIV